MLSQASDHAPKKATMPVGFLSSAEPARPKGPIPVTETLAPCVRCYVKMLWNFQSRRMVPMRSKVITIVIVGITIGFLLGLGMVALLRAVTQGEDVALSIAFTVLVLLLAASLIWYLVKTPL